MILLAPHITAFLQERLPIERRASPNTCDSYAHAFRLLFEYAGDCMKVPPSQIHLEQLDAPLVVNFLNHLEKVRGNGAGSRNIRLAAIKSFMHYMEYRVPSAVGTSDASWPYPRRRWIPGWSGTSAPKRCKPSWMPLTPLPGTAFVTAPCFISALLVDSVFQNWSGSASRI